MSVPEHFEEINLEMSNFDHVIDDGFEEALVGHETFGRHSAWNFNGITYHLDGNFHTDVWVYGSHSRTITADNLQDLMTDTNDVFGYQ